MRQKLLIGLVGLMIGVGLGWWLVADAPTESVANLSQIWQPRKQVIGFMPFWLIGNTETDYAKYLTTLSYFSLNIDRDGKIQKFTNPQETEPGWYTLNSGKADEILTKSKQQKLKLSLVMFAGDPEQIDQLVSDPVNHANNLIDDVAPVMRQHGFTDLNLDIEDVSPASESARLNFTKFVTQVKKQLEDQKLGSLTIEISPSDMIHQRLTDPVEIGQIADYVVMMAYDYHYIGSSVTGPVSPINGVGQMAEFDIETAVQLAKAQIPSSKLILGIPLYGYEWETLDKFGRAAVIPGTGVTASNLRIEQLAKNCPDCEHGIDSVAQESYLIQYDPETKTYHQFFYPTEVDTAAKVKYVQHNQLDGLALWALGYEGQSVMKPLQGYLGR